MAFEDIARWRDDGGTVEIESLAVRWGTLTVDARGTMSLDDRNRPLAALSATVRGHRAVVHSLVQAGTLRPSEGAAAKIALSVLSKSADNGGIVPAAHRPERLVDRRAFAAFAGAAPRPYLGRREAALGLGPDLPAPGSSACPAFDHTAANGPAFRANKSSRASPCPHRMARCSADRSSLKRPSISSTASRLCRKTSRHMTGSDAAIRVKSRKPPAEYLNTSDSVTDSRSAAVPTML